MLYSQVLEDLRGKRDRKLSGSANGIPFKFPRFRDYICDIEPGSYIGLLGSSGTGKSKLTRDMFVYHPIDYAMRNNYPLKIVYFALEDPKIKIYKNVMSHYLFTRHNYSIGMWQLESKGDFIFPDEAEKLLVKDKEFYDWFDKNVIIIENCLTPSQIEGKCDQIKERLPEGTHVICIVDNYSNLVPDAGQDEWTSLRYFSRNIVRQKLCKVYNWTVIGILQQDNETDKHIFRSVAAGKTSASAIEPNASGIGGTKIIIQDFYYAIGLFNPWKYEILKYPNNKGYDTDILRGKARFLNIFKNNESEVGGRLGLYFDKHEIFRELPLISDESALSELYAAVIQEEKERQQKFVNLKMF